MVGQPLALAGNIHVVGCFAKGIAKIPLQDTFCPTYVRVNPNCTCLANLISSSVVVFICSGIFRQCSFFSRGSGTAVVDDMPGLLPFLSGCLQASSLIGGVIAIDCAVLGVLNLVVLLLLDWTHTYPISLPSSQRIFQLLVPLKGVVGRGLQQLKLGRPDLRCIQIDLVVSVGILHSFCCMLPKTIAHSLFYPIHSLYSCQDALIDCSPAR